MSLASLMAAAAASGCVQVAEVAGVVEEAVGEVVGGAVLAEAGDGGWPGRLGGGVVVAGEAGAGQIAFGAQHGGQVPGRAGVELGEQLAGGGGVPQVMSSAGGQRPRPAQAFMADPEGADMRESAAGVAQRVLRLYAGGGGEGFRDVDQRLVLGVFAGPQVPQSREHSLRRPDIAAQRRQPAPVAGEVLDVAQLVGVRGLGEGVVGGVPVTEQEQCLGQVRDREGQHCPVAG